jgi:hypothetical protein
LYGLAKITVGLVLILLTQLVCQRFVLDTFLFCFENTTFHLRILHTSTYRMVHTFLYGVPDTSRNPNKQKPGLIAHKFPARTKNTSAFFKEDIIGRWKEKDPKKNQRFPTMALLCPQTLPKQGRFSKVVACASVFRFVWIGLFISVSRNPKAEIRNPHNRLCLVFSVFMDPKPESRCNNVLILTVLISQNTKGLHPFSLANVFFLIWFRKS